MNYYYDAKIFEQVNNMFKFKKILKYLMIILKFIILVAIKFLSYPLNKTQYYVT